jgi:hypothetical protein
MAKQSNSGMYKPVSSGGKPAPWLNKYHAPAGAQQAPPKTGVGVKQTGPALPKTTFAAATRLPPNAAPPTNKRRGK